MSKKRVPLEFHDDTRNNGLKEGDISLLQKPVCGPSKKILTVFLRRGGGFYSRTRNISLQIWNLDESVIRPAMARSSRFTYEMENRLTDDTRVFQPI